MQDDSEAEVVRIANDIKKYLADHPNAADTLDGITKWWFLRQRFTESAQLVQKALDYLVSESQVERKTNLGSDYVYFNTQRPRRNEK